MTRVRVWYDDACDQIFISGEMHSYAPRSLACVLNGNGSTILIHMAGTVDTYVAGGNYADFGGADGIPFPTPQATKAYLDGVFSRTPSPIVPSAKGIATFALIAGMPVAVSRSDGSLLPARADTYAQAFVIGLALADIDAGFAGATTREALTLPDWSRVAGTPSLAVGQPYFLAAEGGLTLRAVDMQGYCAVRVGNATAPQTFTPAQFDPILL